VERRADFSHANSYLLYFYEKDKNMGHIYADIELINSDDLTLARRNIIGENEVKRLKVSAIVDADCFYMAINENIQEVLQLSVLEKKRIKLPNGQSLDCDLVGYLEIRFKDCTAYCTAIVLPGDSEPLLGRRPLQEMNVLLHPQRQELVENPKPIRL
jgi:hypothetical protein